MLDRSPHATWCKARLSPCTSLLTREQHHDAFLFRKLLGREIDLLGGVLNVSAELDAGRYIVAHGDMG